MMWYWGAGANWWALLFGILLNAVFWGLLIWAIVALFGWARHGRSYGSYGSYAPSDPERTLAMRFATGEIDADEYYSRLAVLRERRGPDTPPAPPAYPAAT